MFWLTNSMRINTVLGFVVPVRCQPVVSRRTLWTNHLKVQKVRTTLYECIVVVIQSAAVGIQDGFKMDPNW